jgi:hypothetical protein
MLIQDMLQHCIENVGMFGDMQQQWEKPEIIFYTNM